MPRKLLILVAATWFPLMALATLVFIEEPATSANRTTPASSNSRENSSATKHAKLSSSPATVNVNQPETNDDAQDLKDRGGAERSGIPLAFEPQELILGDIRPHAGAKASVIVYSQIWAKFTISRIQSSLPALRWDVIPAESESLERLGAKSGYLVTVQVPPSLDHGKLRGTLSVHAIPEDSPSQVHKHDLPVRGRVLRRLAVYGEKINFLGVIDLGTSFVGHSTTTRVLMKVRDEQLELPVRRITTDPDFLEVKVSPGRALGEYYLAVTIPKHATPCNRTTGNLGSISIHFDHPRIPDLELDAFFSVTEKSPYYEPLFLGQQQGEQR